MRLLVKRRRELGQKTPFMDWQFLLFSHNEHEKPLAKKLAKEIGVDIIRFVLPNIPPEHKEEWRPGPKKPDPPTQAEEKAGTDKTALPKLGHVKYHRCSWVYRSIFFNWDGGILPCCHEQIDNEKDFGSVDDLADFQKMWNNEKYQQARRLANFKINPDKAPIPMSCAGCVMPKTPFILHEKGYALPPKILKKIKPLVDDPPPSE
jgi:hypothetical protein